MGQAGLQLINLESQGVFTFQFFPATVQSSDRVNWQPQEVTIGIKPLFYANREPRSINFPELWFDNTDTGESLTPTITELRALCEETEKGTPPAVLAAWGDRHERCVIEEVSIEEMFFTEEGYPIRAKVSLRLIQLQPEVTESTGVTVGS